MSRPLVINNTNTLYYSRSCVHCHGTAKLDNDPGLCQLTQTTLKGFLAQKFKDDNDSPDTIELDNDIEAGQRAADIVCQYVELAIIQLLIQIHQVKICG